MDGDFCTFFMKTGACRYGFQCKRRHIYPVISETLLIDHMYRDKYSDSRTITNSQDDILLEYDHKEMQGLYNGFYEDCIPEFEKFGKIIQYKTCNNLVSHLRGNVFIQFEDPVSAIKAYLMMENRYYAGYPLNISFSLIKDWKQAVCAYDEYCPKFVECNFQHVYKNPGGKYQVPLARRGGRDKKNSRSGSQDQNKRNNRRSNSKDSLQKKSYNRDYDKKVDSRYKNKRDYDRDYDKKDSHRHKEKKDRHREKDYKKSRDYKSKKYRSRSRSDSRKRKSDKDKKRKRSDSRDNKHEKRLVVRNSDSRSDDLNYKNKKNNRNFDNNRTSKEELTLAEGFKKAPEFKDFEKPAKTKKRDVPEEFEEEEEDDKTDFYQLIMGFK